MTSKYNFLSITHFIPCIQKEKNWVFQISLWFFFLWWSKLNKNDNGSGEKKLIRRHVPKTADHGPAKTKIKILSSIFRSAILLQSVLERQEESLNTSYNQNILSRAWSIEGQLWACLVDPKYRGLHSKYNGGGGPLKRKEKNLAKASVNFLKIASFWSYKC